jgi:predicted PurR-regulated permease PerM
VTAVAQASWAPTRAILRVIFIVLAVAVALWMLYALTGVILLVVLAGFFAYLIAPLVEFVAAPRVVRGRTRVVPRPLAIGVVYVLILGGLGAAFSFLLPRLGTQITQFAQQVPTYVGFLRARAERFAQVYEDYQVPAAVREAINGAALRTIEATGKYVTEGLGGLLIESIGFLPWLVLIPILSFFFLKDASTIRQSALRVLPRGRIRWRGQEFFGDINATLAAYIRAQLVACLLIGTVCTVGFAVIGLPYALLLGVVAGLLEFIPLVGPLLVAVLATIIAGFSSVRQAIAAAVFLGVLRIVHDYVTYPRLIRHGIHLHPLAVILAILSGAELAGVAGIFLAIPVIAVLAVAYRHWFEYRGGEGLVAGLLRPTDTGMASSPPTAPLGPSDGPPAVPAPAVQAGLPGRPSG